MTVETTTTIAGPYPTSGTAKAFPFGFKALSAQEVRVVVERDGEQADVSPSLYRVSLAGQSGTITFTDAPTAGGMLYILAAPDFRQGVSFSNQAPFLPESHNEANDRAALRDQQLLAMVRRAPMVPLNATSVEGRFPRVGRDGRFYFEDAGPGATGPADNTYTTMAALLASDPTRKSARLVPEPGESEAAGNFSYIGGQWTRQDAAGLSYNRRTAKSKMDDITRTIFDVASPAEQAQILIGGIDLSVYIERMKAIGGRWRIPDLGYQYEMKSRVVGLPKAMRMLFDDGVSVIYTGALPAGVGGLFETTADHVVIACYDPEGRATFRSQIPGARLWLHSGKSASGMRTRGVTCIDMKVQLAYPADEAAVVAGDLSGAPRNAAAYDWECSYTGRDANAAEGVVMHYYVQRGRCARGRATRAGSGYQAWGGNADFNKHGTPSDDPTIEAARLKCRDILVSDVVCADMTNTFIFLCMVEGGRVDRCIGDKAWDVGFDAEGCRDVSFVDCQGKHATNGAFSIYFFADNVVIRNPTVTCDLATTYPTAIATINPSRRADYVPGVSIIGGRIESREGSGKPIGIIVEAMAAFRMEGVEMVHAQLIATSIGLHSVSVVGNRFRLTRRLPFAVDLVAVGPDLTNLGFDGPRAHISGNSFESTVAQPVGTRLAYLASKEANVPPSYLYADNDGSVRTGPDRDTATGYAGLHIDWAGTNPGVRLFARLLGNGGRGHPMTYKRQSGAASDPVITIGTKITVPDGASGTTDRIVNTNLLLDGTPVVPAAI